MESTEAQTATAAAAPDERPWLTPKEAAAILDICVASVYSMMRQGTLRSRIKPGPAQFRPRFLIDPASVKAVQNIPTKF